VRAPRQLSLVFGLGLGLVLPSCEPAADVPRGVVVARFWYSYGGKNREVLEDLVGRFNDEQARAGLRVRIEGTFQGGYFEALGKLRAALLGGDPPALTHVVAEAVPLLAEAGVLEDLGPHARGPDPLDLADLVPALAQEGTFGAAPGRPLVAIPFNRSTPILYLNTRLLREAGLAAPRTWVELRDAARALTRRRGARTTRWGVACPLSWWFWLAALGQADGHLLSGSGQRAAFGGEAGVEALSLFLDLARAGLLRIPPGRDYAAWERAHADFIAERAAMVITSTAFLAYITDHARFEVGAAPLPAGIRRAVPTGGTFFVIPRAAPRADKRAAWAFVRWMTEPARTAEWARRTGYLPVRTSAIDSPEMRALYAERPAFRVALDQLEAAEPFPWSTALLAISREAVQPALERAVAGHATAAEAVHEAAALADTRLREAREARP
jgi:sn-glycerol 3-phosphate transport system substrate-binding protein